MIIFVRFYKYVYTNNNTQIANYIVDSLLICYN